MYSGCKGGLGGQIPKLMILGVCLCMLLAEMAMLMWSSCCLTNVLMRIPRIVMEPCHCIVLQQWYVDVVQLLLSDCDIITQ